MKTKSILLVAIALIVSSVALADEPGSPKLVVLNQKESGLFKVIYENAKSTKVRMTILNSNGEALYSENLKVNEGFILPVNFKGMTPGEYSIEVSDEKGKQTQKVSYLTSAPTASRIHVAKLSPDNNKYLLSIANEGQVNVRILDGWNNIVHEQDVTVAGSFGQVYNLKIEGTPTFEVTDANGTVKTIKY